jgi:hypothetical protein
MESPYITKDELREYLAKELPAIMEENPDIQRSVFLISRKRFADKDATEDRFERMLEELKNDREENNRKWKETILEFQEERKETNKRLDETIREFKKELKETNKKPDETGREVKEFSRLKSAIGALGARWGTASESSFRNALKGILEKRFNVQVIHVTEYDHEGFVFRHPDQVELDIIIKNGDLIICEIKSSMSRSDIYTFHRKVRFYEKQHNRKATSMIVVSPMLDKYAQATADRLGIEIYSYSEDVTL